MFLDFWSLCVLSIKMKWKKWCRRCWNTWRKFFIIPINFFLKSFNSFSLYWKSPKTSISWKLLCPTYKRNACSWIQFWKIWFTLNQRAIFDVVPSKHWVYSKKEQQLCLLYQIFKFKVSWYGQLYCSWIFLSKFYQSFLSRRKQVLFSP